MTRSSDARRWPTVPVTLAGILLTLGFVSSVTHVMAAVAAASGDPALALIMVFWQAFLYLVALMKIFDVDLAAAIFITVATRALHILFVVPALMSLLGG